MTLYTEGFGRFVTSTTAPIATGWSDSCRVGISPTERTRLSRRTERCGLDLSITVFQHLCFRAYGIPRVCRGDYLVIDRHRLGYLNAIEKLNCVYCGYANGLIADAREITARTEQFWCPIKHAQRTLDAHHRAEKYFDYGDVDAWRSGLKELRRDWDDEPSSPTSKPKAR